MTTEAKPLRQQGRSRREIRRSPTLPERVDAVHSLAGRWRVVTAAYWRHRQFGWWALWKLGTPIKHIMKVLTAYIDTVVYPELRTLTLDRPVFIVGHPRSGTTFLQGVLYETDVASMFQTWEMFLPTLTIRRVARPAVSLLRQFGMRVFQGQESGHQILLDGIEDDEGIFLHQIDSEVLGLACPWLYIDPDLVEFGIRLGSFNHFVRRRSCEFYRDMLMRQVLYTGKPRVVSKSPASARRISELLELFPDARFIHVIRKPEDAIRSYLSVHAAWHSKLLSQEQRRTYMRNRYRWSVSLYRDFERLKSGIPKNQLLTIPFDELTTNVLETTKRVIQFAEMEPPPEFWDKIRKREQTQHRKHHRNIPLEDFGLSVDEIRRDLKSVYEEYNLT